MRQKPNLHLLRIAKWTGEFAVQEPSPDDVFIDEITFPATDGYRALRATLERVPLVSTPQSGRDKERAATHFKFQTASQSHTPPRSRRACRASFACVKPSELQRAWGMPGARCTRSLAWEKIEPHERSHREVHRIHPAFPHAMVLTVSFELFPVIGLCCHRRLRKCFSKLDASVEASEPHDFAVRITHRSSAARQRPLHPVPNVRDDRERPSVWDETAALMK